MCPAPARAGAPHARRRTPPCSTPAPFSSLGSHDPIHTVAPIRCVCLCSPVLQALCGSRGRVDRRQQGGRRAPPGPGARDRGGAAFHEGLGANTTERSTPSLRARIAHAPSIACPVSRASGRGAALRAATPTQTCTIRCSRKRGGGARLTSSRSARPDRRAPPSASAGHAAENGCSTTVRIVQRAMPLGTSGPPGVPRTPDDYALLRTNTGRTHAVASGQRSRRLAPRASLCLVDVGAGRSGGRVAWRGS